MSADNVFGPIITGKHVRTAMRTHLRTWLPSYLAEVAREDDRPTPLPMPQSWVSALDLVEGKFTEDAIPSCVIVAPGLLEDPIKKGGMFIVRWAVSVGYVVSGQDRENTFDLSELCAAAVRGAVMHRPSLSGFASGIDWIGERYDDIPNEMARTLAAGTVQFGIEVQSALATVGGPDVPLAEPTEDPGPRATFSVVSSTAEGV